MKKYLSLILIAILVVSLAGCGSLKTKEKSLDSSNGKFKKPTASQTPKDTDKGTENKVEETSQIPYPLEMYFSSGAGGWCTSITINRDGSFKGEYHDSDMGDNDEDYPNGTIYVCSFSGKFTNITKINEYSYSLTLQSISTEEDENVSYIEDGIRYITSSPYGLTDDNGGYAKEFILYTPETPVNSLPEDFLYWWPLRFSKEKPATLSHYGLLNKSTQDGFFTYSISED